GMVAQYLDDGVLAYFGYPAAHENDAERAILSGLAILKAVAALKPAADAVVQTRIAIGSGVVVVGDLVREGVTQENAAIGETTNLGPPPASDRGAQFPRHLARHTPPGRCPVRLSRSRAARAQGISRASARASGARSQQGREPVRGTASSRNLATPGAGGGA